MGSTEIIVSVFFPAAVLVAIISGIYLYYGLAYLSIMLHEAAHMAVAAFFGLETASLRILPVGMSADIDMGNCSRRNKILIYASGPAMSLILSAAAYLLWIHIPGKPYCFYIISLTNLYLAAFNLVPAIPLDGGRILQAILNDSIGLITAAKYLRFTALVLCIAITAAGICQIAAGTMNFSLLFIGLYFIVFFITGRMEASLMNIKQLLYRRQRLLNKGIYQARDLVVLRDMRLGSVIKALDYDRYHFIYLLDDNLRLLRMITEDEIIGCMLKHPEDMTFGELLGLLET